MIEVLIIALIAFAIVSLIFCSISYKVHIDMVKGERIRWGYGTFNQFVREFEKHKWDNKGWSGSFFDYSTNSMYHASIIQFDGIGMIMKTPIDWLRVIMYTNNLTKTKYNLGSHKW